MWSFFNSHVVKEIFWIKLKGIKFTKSAIKNDSIVKLQVFQTRNSIVVEGRRKKREKQIKSYVKSL